MRADVVVVGGGLSGLAVAALLTEAGFEVTLVEAAEQLGGRVRERELDGFRVGGGHLAHTTWPALSALNEFPAAPYSRLRLRTLASGVRLHTDGAAPRFGAAPTRPQRSMATMLTPIGTMADRSRLSKQFFRLSRSSIDATLAGPEFASSESFAVRGYSPVLVDGFLRRYLTAMCADEDLATSIRGTDWFLRMLVRGRFAVPEGGFEALVGLLAGRVDRHRAGDRAILLGTRAHEVHADRVATDAGLIRTRAVVVAADPTAAVTLLPGLHEPRMRAQTTLWHAVDSTDLPPGPERVPSLLLDGDPASPVARTAVFSRAGAGHAPYGRELICTVVAGHDGKQFDALDRGVLTRLQRIHGAPARAFQTIDIRYAERALVSLDAPYNFARPVRLIGGLYVCGDHRGLPNIEGALASAARAAEAVIADLRR